MTGSSGNPPSRPPARRSADLWPSRNLLRTTLLASGIHSFPSTTPRSRRQAGTPHQLGCRCVRPTDTRHTGVHTLTLLQTLRHASPHFRLPTLNCYRPSSFPSTFSPSPQSPSPATSQSDALTVWYRSNPNFAETTSCLNDSTLFTLVNAPPRYKRASPAIPDGYHSVLTCSGLVE